MTNQIKYVIMITEIEGRKKEKMVAVIIALNFVALGIWTGMYISNKKIK